MNCTRCGAERRKTTARFCHVCGAPYELAPTDVQPTITEGSGAEGAPQPAQDLKPPSFAPRGPDEHAIPAKSAALEDHPPQPPAADYPDWLGEAAATLREQQPARLNERPRSAPSVWPDEPPAWERQPQEAFSSLQTPQPLQNPPSSGPQNERGSQPYAGRAAPPAPWQAPPAEAPIRSAARGPVPGAFQRSRPVQRQRRRVPLGVMITLGLLLVFVVAGVGIYAFAAGSQPQEPSALTPYTDPGHHFSITYPTVWTVKKLSNGVRFTDATDTAELWVTYTPNTSNLTAEQFANQEAANAGISAPAPDTQTFAGTTWVQRSGIVTQTSGISQDIFIFVTIANNLLYEVREVAPLDGYKDANQVFMRMLQSLTLR